MRPITTGNIGLLNNVTGNSTTIEVERRFAGGLATDKSPMAVGIGKCNTSVHEFDAGTTYCNADDPYECGFTCKVNLTTTAVSMTVPVTAQYNGGATTECANSAGMVVNLTAVPAALPPAGGIAPVVARRVNCVKLVRLTPGGVGNWSHPACDP